MSDHATPSPPPQVSHSAWQGWATAELGQYVDLACDPRLLGAQLMQLVRENAVPFLTAAERGSASGAAAGVVATHPPSQTHSRALPVACEVTRAQCHIAISSGVMFKIILIPITHRIKRNRFYLILAKRPLSKIANAQILHKNIM